ncbi:DNA-binding protein [Undibacterium sp. Dicai25W]|uniref:DNA-binding protein n=1 Tax=Undibacterium sp. Dicai25W TaxID=3413034 RepID=UPI003BEF78A3
MKPFGYITFTMRDLDPEIISSTKNNFAARGESIAEWARQNDFNLQLVYKILNGKSKALRGESHRIAVKLGIKQKIE